MTPLSAVPHTSRWVQSRFPVGSRLKVAHCAGGRPILAGERQDVASRKGVKWVIRMLCHSVLALCATPAPAAAQVVEISDNGDVTVYDALSGQKSHIPSPQVNADDPAGSDAFAAAAKRHRIDAALLRAVAWAESRGRSNAISNKGAIGIMQLMPATAAALGVDPRDPLANIDGGAAYLAQQLSTFGTVPLALAAYNAGPGAVIRYRGVPPYAETRAYVDNILRRLNVAPTADERVVRRPSGAAVAMLASTPEPQTLSVMLIEVPSQ